VNPDDRVYEFKRVVQDDILPPRSYIVEYVDAVICPRCGRETHPDAVAEACRGNHYTETTWFEEAE
jgi:hypothetical protein